MESDLRRCCVCKGLLQEPILLGCLHNCCKSCMLEATAQLHHKQMTCPGCSTVTDVAVVHPNLFIATQKLSSDVKCIPCQRKGYDDILAEMYCKQCAKTLCEACARDHNIHISDHITAPLHPCTANESSSASTVLCPQHREQLKLMCFTCMRLMCVTCCAACLSEKHDVNLCECEAVRNKMAIKKQEIVEFLRQIVDLTDLLDQDGWLAAVNAARTACSQVLRRNKRAALDCLDEAYGAAQQDLEKLSDMLSAEVSNEVTEIINLKKDACSAIAYGQLMLNSGDATWLLDQCDRVASCLGRHVRRLSALSATSAIKDRLVMPENFSDVTRDLILRTLIGTPELYPAKRKQQECASPRNGIERPLAGAKRGLLLLQELRKKLLDEEEKLVIESQSIGTNEIF